ncbi:hypothetical protein BDA99DRAFT_598118 [Phascolomyces articulosus]|uniref:Heterokaryon incompatibility domain-containing protein n=1 Tax=Phascolomyces articulosus TaxID=60185 RepID=A0AAD5K3X9_9FUNG|nr:hypothetical protein BDA99DRAFT_598118 [Phascolomyces articulosus]
MFWIALITIKQAGRVLYIMFKELEFYFDDGTILISYIFDDRISLELNHQAYLLFFCHHRNPYQIGCPFNRKEKMYVIMYETAQQRIVDPLPRNSYPLLKKVPNDFLKPDSMSTKLVCISDMEIVYGSQINFNDSDDSLEYTDIFEGEAKYVKFERIIQQICKDFYIKYICFDQMCTNQNDKEEKHNEIRKVHHIYDDVYCTVALVLDINVVLCGIEQYFKRLWT